MPHKVKSIFLQISADGSEYHLDSPFFISADLQLTTARDCSLDTEQLQNLLMEAYRQRRPATEFPPEDIALATALAHTMPTDQAIETYGRYVTERYLHEPTEIIRRVGQERLPPRVTTKEALQELSQAIDQLREQETLTVETQDAYTALFVAWKKAVYATGKTGTGQGTRPRDPATLTP